MAKPLPDAVLALFTTALEPYFQQCGRDDTRFRFVVDLAEAYSLTARMLDVRGEKEVVPEEDRDALFYTLIALYGALLQHWCNINPASDRARGNTVTFAEQLRITLSL